MALINWEDCHEALRLGFCAKLSPCAHVSFGEGIEIPREECVTRDIALKTGYIGHYKHAMVPMLELDDGTQLGEALSIWLYLETLHPNPPLMGTTALEKAVISAWERRAYDEGMVGHAEIFRNSHPQFV